MAAPSFAYIPTDVADATSMQETADNWAKDQMSKVADDWADQQNLSAPTSSDSLTNPLGTGNAPAPSPEPAAGASVVPPEQSAGSLPPSSLPAPAPAASTTLPAPDAPAPLDLQRGAPVDRTSQFAMGLSSADAMAFCGPAAAIAFAKTYGRNPTVDEARQLAQSVGWNPNQGMAGVQSEQALLTKMGVQTKLEQGINWDHVAQDANNGNPVIIDTPGHYFYVTGARQGPNGPEFNVGTSGTDLRAGATWMSPMQMAQTMGTPRAALYADHPMAQGPSQAEKTPVAQVSDALGGAFKAVSQKAQDVAQAVTSVGQTDQPGPPIQGDYTAALPGGRQDPMEAAVQAGKTLASPLTDEQPWMRNLVNLGTKQMQANAGISPNEPGTQNLTPAEQYVMARGMATGLAQTLGPEDIAARAVTGGAGSLAKSAEVAQDVARSKMPAEATAGFASGGDILKAALDALKGYPAESAQPITEAAQKALDAGAPASSVGSMVKRWMEENPLPKNADLAAPEVTRLEPEVQATLPKQPTEDELMAQWQQQLDNVRASKGFQSASPAEQSQMVADAQKGFAADQAAPPPPTVPPTTTGAPPPGEVPPGPPAPVSRAGITPDTIDAAHQRITAEYARKGATGSTAEQAAHDQLDQMLANGAAPDEVARFLTTDVEGKTAGPMSWLRTERTGSLAGGITTEGKVALSPVIQTAMRAPVGALKAIVTGQPGDIARGLQGGLAGLAEGAADALQTIRYGTNYRAALTGGAQGGYGFSPGPDVLGKNLPTRLAGTALLGLVRTHGALADISAGIGRGANAALGATPEAAAEAGQQWAMRSGNYGTIGKAVANAFEGIRQTNPALDLVGQILMPFYRVGYNALTQGIERSPVGLLGTGVDVARGAVGQGPYAAGAVNKAVTPVGDRLANNMFGVGLAALGFAQAAQGNITGEHPANNAPQWSVRVPERAALGPLEALAKRDGAGNLWVPIRDLGPAGEALAQSAALYEGVRGGNGNVAKMAEQTAQAYVAHVYDESWVRGMAETLHMISDIKDIGNKRSGIANSARSDLNYRATNLGQSFVPQSELVGQTAKAAGNPDLARTLLRAAGMRR